MEVVNRRYIMHGKLGEGGMGTVYRATDRLTGQTVAYKQVLTQVVDNDATVVANVQTQASSINLRLALAREFELLASVQHPNVIRVLDYGFDEERNSYFTMSLLEEPQTILEAARNQPLPRQADLLIQLLQALAYLHRRGIVHCDLKPDNVLVTQDGVVRVVDFGLATLHSRPTTGEDSSGGTIAYMAPEVIQGNPPSFAADIYAVGVMAYEMFVGQHPFNLQNLSEMISAVLFQQADMSLLEKTIQIDKPLNELDPEQIYRIQSENIGEHLVPFLERLLEKDPDLRVDNADKAMQLLSEVTHAPLPAESIEIRESFLQAADFIGRDDEMATLTFALDEATRGIGSTWLIGGESGVGKSRMISELRTAALVRGVLVLRGQAVQEHSGAYEVWQNILQNLIIHVEITDLEASILKPIVPNISKLIDKAVTDAPPLEPQQAQERLHGTVISLFRRVKRPMIVFLEDLQWTSTSLDLLRRLNALVTDMRVLIVGSYRNDERPDLPQDLSIMKHIKLERLSENNVSELAISMIGESGRNPELIELLQRETEGNTLFLVEVVRTLAEEAGKLSEVGVMELPKTVLAGGIIAILNRRLERIPATMRPLLEMAALMGRQLDLATLKELLQLHQFTLKLDDWLTICANLAVLEIQDDIWRFTHDKLREATLVDVDEATKPDLHEAIATSIENAYTTPEIKAVSLAFHWGQAQNTQKEKAYSIIAGEQALQTSSYRLAQQYLARVIDLEETETAKKQTYYYLGEVNRALNDYDAAMSYYENALSQGHTPALLGIGRTHLDKGNFEMAIPSLEKALKTFREGKDQANESYALYGISRAKSDARQMDESKDFAKQALEIAHKIGEQRSESLALNALGLAGLQTGQLQEARDYLSQAHQIDHEIGNRRGEAFSIMYLGVSYFLTGQFNQGIPHVKQAVDIAIDIGDKRLQGLAQLNLGSTYEQIGEIEQAAEVAEQVYIIFKAIGDTRHQAISLSNLAYASMQSGNYTKAVETFQLALVASQESHFMFFELASQCDAAHASWLMGNMTATEEHLHALTETLEQNPIPPIQRYYHSLKALVAITKSEFEAALSSAEQGIEIGGDREIHIAPLMKAVALLHLERADDAKTSIEEAHTFLAEQQTASPEKYILKYAVAFAEALKLLVASPAELMQQLNTAMSAYQQATEACAAKGVIESALKYLAFIESLDQMGALVQLRMQLENAL